MFRIIIRIKQECVWKLFIIVFKGGEMNNNKLSGGIPGFDTIMTGGFVPGYSYLLAGSTGTATLIVDEESTILLANKKCEKIFGSPPTSFWGKKGRFFHDGK
jgi:predicted ATP-dependent serine protease